jgi:hypothetical protein
VHLVETLPLLDFEVRSTPVLSDASTLVHLVETLPLLDFEVRRQPPLCTDSDAKDRES